MYCYVITSIILTISLIISNIGINYYYYYSHTNEINMIFNSLGMLCNLISIQAFASKNRIDLNTWIFISFGSMIIGSTSMMIQYYLHPFMFLFGGEVCKIFVSIIGICIWTKYQNYLRTHRYNYLLWPFIILLVVCVVSLGYNEMLSYLQLTLPDKNNETSIQIINIFIFITSFYPMLLLSLRFFNSWYILILFLLVTTFLEITFNYPVYLTVNNLTIMVGMGIFLLHYPEINVTSERSDTPTPYAPSNFQQIYIV